MKIIPAISNLEIYFLVILSRIVHNYFILLLQDREIFRIRGICGFHVVWTCQTLLPPFLAFFTKTFISNSTSHNVIRDGVQRANTSLQLVSLPTIWWVSGSRGPDYSGSGLSFDP